MTNEKVESKLDQVVGSVKETAGKLTGDKETQAEGFVEKALGKVKEVAADVTDTVKGAVEGLTSNDEEENK